MADDTPIILRACSKCGVEKPHDETNFRPNRRKCRDCERQYTLAYNKTRDPEKTAAWLREQRRKYPERYKEYDRRNYEKNKAGTDYHARRYQRIDKQKAREDLKRWKAENPDKARAIEVARQKRVNERRRSDPKFKEKLNKKSREWQKQKRQTDLAFREEANRRNREWLARNKEKMRPYYRAKGARLRQNSVGHRIMCSMRRRVHTALKGAKKSASISALLGCTVEEARAYIESMFQPGMTWDNWGRGWRGAREWHLDHVKPLASFDLTDPLQLAEACHYSNLQPLWAVDNLVKGVR